MSLVIFVYNNFSFLVSSVLLTRGVLDVKKKLDYVYSWINPKKLNPEEEFPKEGNGRITKNGKKN